VACASTPPYNPDHLSMDQLSHVEEVCQTVMGLRPTDALRDNLWAGDPDPAASTNDYRGCIATLSNSLQSGSAVRASSGAERDCRSKGLTTGSSDLALCVLSTERNPPAGQVVLASVTVRPFLVPTGATFAGHVLTGVSKEQLACAEAGLDPTENGFAGCVQGLTNVMSAGFMEEGYRN
jgi:hypothetical protein